MAAAALRLLTGYAWPGNVRELENAIERAVVLSAGPEILPHDLPLVGEGSTPPVVAAEDFHGAVQQFKRDFLRAALTRANGNQTKAAQAIGLQRTYLSRLLKELDLRAT